jgi:hypothetical protein
MGKDLNISVLVAARNEYIEQLKYILVPLIIQGFNSIYNDALRISQGKHVIMKFQDLLEGIVQWNQTILQEEAKRIKRKCSYIMDIVTAIFVSSVKILASVRLKGKNDNINIKIPTSDIFIHCIYMESAEQIWNEPFLFYHKPHPNKPESIQLCKASVVSIISDAIDRAFRQMLPLDDILQEYLANALNGESSESESDSEEGSDVLNGDDIVSEESFGDDEYSNDSEPENDAPVKTFNFGNPPGEQYQPDITQPIQPSVPPPQDQFQATTFDELNNVNNVKKENYDSDSSSSGSSRSSRSSSSSSSGSSRHSHRSHRSHHGHKSSHHREENKHSFF